MKDSIHKYFQVGTIQWMIHPKRDVIESIRQIASDDFFDAIVQTHHDVRRNCRTDNRSRTRNHSRTQIDQIILGVFDQRCARSGKALYFITAVSKIQRHTCQQICRQ